VHLVQLNTLEGPVWVNFEHVISLAPEGTQTRIVTTGTDEGGPAKIYVVETLDQIMTKIAADPDLKVTY
jgi:hypothetical protein